MVSNASKKPQDGPSYLAVIDSISGKWTTLIVCILSEKPRRNGELKREAVGISHKVLTQTLRRLERDGVVARKVYPVVPPQVEYSLTPLGKSVMGLLSNMCIWAKEHYAQVKKARTTYDNKAKRLTL
jgi:DNA-binding HxlR family transcriptional regulator